MILTPRKYDGHLLHQRFAFEYFQEQVSPLGNIIAFRGEMEVLADGMIDQADVLADAFIWSEDAINFLWEIPILANSPFGAVAYQQLFNQRIANILSGEVFLNKSLQMNGDDIMLQGLDNGKCSVSITHIKDGAALGHTGINIHAGKKAPKIAYSTELSDAQVEAFMQKVIKCFQSLNQELFVATCKILSK
jgi:hypothetical protein